MKRRFRPCRRTRLRLTLLLALSVFFQPLALAFHLCATADMPADNIAMTMPCDGMVMAHAKQASPLCTWHCAQPSVLVQDAHSPSVPALLFAAPLPSPPTFIGLPTAHATYANTALWRPPGIPPAFRFRVLLI